MFAERLSRLQAEMERRQVDVVILVPGANLYYMTGLDFHLMERPTLLMLPAQGLPSFVLPALEKVKFVHNPPYEVQLFTYEDGENPAVGVREAVKALPEIQRFGVEFLRMRVLELKLTQAQLPTAFMDDAQPVMDTLRLYKTPEEIAYHREAIRISEVALEQVIAEVKPGMTELQIAARLATTQINMGGGDMPFPPIVLSGPNAALPHGVPSDRQVQKGEVLLIDFGTRHKGYISDITRTFFVGQPPDEYLRVYEAVKLANQVGRETARPGMVISEVDKTVREVIEDAGYGEYFTHRTGHGMGLDGHENPSVDKSNHNVLEPGMVFTIEPGIYIVGKVGVRIEDNVVVTKEGCESLTTFPRESRIL